MMALLIYSTKSALVLTLLYLPYTLMLRQESFFRMNRITLLTILMLSLVLPKVDIPSLATPEQPVVYDMQQRIMLMTQEAKTHWGHATFCVAIKGEESTHAYYLRTKKFGTSIYLC